MRVSVKEMDHLIYSYKPAAREVIILFAQIYNFDLPRTQWEQAFDAIEARMPASLKVVEKGEPRSGQELLMGRERVLPIAYSRHYRNAKLDAQPRPRPCNESSHPGCTTDRAPSL